MQLGMVGLGRMGSNIVRRLLRAGHECVVYDVNAESIKELSGEGWRQPVRWRSSWSSWRSPGRCG